MGSNGFKLIFNFFCSIDIDECAPNIDNCDIDARATCTNTPGAFTCACNAGYSGNGITCVGSYLIHISFYIKLIVISL